MRTSTFILTVFAVAVAMAGTKNKYLDDQQLAGLTTALQTYDVTQGIALDLDPKEVGKYYAAYGNALRAKKLGDFTAGDPNMAIGGIVQQLCGELRQLNMVLATNVASLSDDAKKKEFAHRYLHTVTCLRIILSETDQQAANYMNNDFGGGRDPNGMGLQWKDRTDVMRSWIGSGAAVGVEGLTQPITPQMHKGNIKQRIRNLESVIRNQRNYVSSLERKANSARNDYDSYKDSERTRWAKGGRVGNGSVSMGKLRTAQNMERLLRNAQSDLDRYENELAQLQDQAANMSEEELRAGPSGASAPAANGNAAPAAGGTKFCTECGTKLPGAAKFCSSCGKKQ